MACNYRHIEAWTKWPQLCKRHIRMCILQWKLLHSWWRHQVETFSALLALCAGNSPVTGEFPYNSQWRGTLIFFYLRLNKRLRDLRRYRAHYDVVVMFYSNSIALCFFGFNSLHVSTGLGNGLAPSRPQIICVANADRYLRRHIAQN